MRERNGFQVSLFVFAAVSDILVSKKDKNSKNCEIKIQNNLFYFVAETKQNKARQKIYT